MLTGKQNVEHERGGIAGIELRAAEEREDDGREPFPADGNHRERYTKHRQPAAVASPAGERIDQVSLLTRGTPPGQLVQPARQQWRH